MRSLIAFFSSQDVQQAGEEVIHYWNSELLLPPCDYTSHIDIVYIYFCACWALSRKSDRLFSFLSLSHHGFSLEQVSRSSSCSISRFNSSLLLSFSYVAYSFILTFFFLWSFFKNNFTTLPSAAQTHTHTHTLAAQWERWESGQSLLLWGPGTLYIYISIASLLTQEPKRSHGPYVWEG